MRNYEKPKKCYCTNCCASRCERGIGDAKDWDIVRKNWTYLITAMRPDQIHRLVKQLCLRKVEELT